MKILAMSGSLRSGSLNSAFLEAVAGVAGGNFQISHYREGGSLPHFSPDYDDAIPESVVALRNRAADADALMIACPEYAGGIPGSFKNVLDWLVGCPDFNSRPVVLVNVAVNASAAEAALRLVLKTMSAPVIETASRRIPIRDRTATAESIERDPQMRSAILSMLDALRSALQ